jgi:hypothetical protein
MEPRKQLFASFSICSNCAAVGPHEPLRLDAEKQTDREVDRRLLAISNQDIIALLHASQSNAI